MSYEILVHPNRAKYDLSMCKSYAGGGAPRPPEHVKRLATEMGDGKPLLGYGLTETNAVGCGIINENYLEKPMSTGRRRSRWSVWRFPKRPAEARVGKGGVSTGK